MNYTKFLRNQKSQILTNRKVSKYKGQYKINEMKVINYDSLYFNYCRVINSSTYSCSVSPINPILLRHIEWFASCNSAHPSFSILCTLLEEMFMAFIPYTPVIFSFFTWTMTMPAEICCNKFYWQYKILVIFDSLF